MIQVCIFVPFLHQETPKPVNVTKVACNRESDQVIMNQIAQVLELRNKISEAQRKKNGGGKQSPVNMKFA